MVERIFGVVKKRWDILNQAPQYSMEIQSQIPPGLAAVHNFILDHDDTDIDHYLDNEPDLLDGNLQEDFGELGDGAIPPQERERASQMRDEIATAMWNSYQQFLHDHPEILEQDIA